MAGIVGRWEHLNLSPKAQVVTLFIYPVIHTFTSEFNSVLYWNLYFTAFTLIYCWSSHICLIAQPTSSPSPHRPVGLCPLSTGSCSSPLGPSHHEDTSKNIVIQVCLISDLVIIYTIYNNHKIGNCLTVCETDHLVQLTYTVPSKLIFKCFHLQVQHVFNNDNIYITNTCKQNHIRLWIGWTDGTCRVYWTKRTQDDLHLTVFDFNAVFNVMAKRIDIMA